MPQNVVFSPHYKPRGSEILIATSRRGKMPVNPRSQPQSSRGMIITTILLLLILSGDIETNPGPNYKFPCLRCVKPVRSNQKGLQCDGCNRWCHTNCERISDEVYTSLSGSDDEWYCSSCCLPHFSDSFFDDSCQADLSSELGDVSSDMIVLYECC